ncbi:MAG: ABC transporter ATP-binding protein [Lachnospiraceae bacterium]
MIRLEDVTKVYKTNHESLTALNHINLSIERGEMAAVVGESGSGKSTLLNILGCMDTLTTGKYYFDETSVDSLMGEQVSMFRKNHVSFVFQNFSLLNNYTAGENVEVPLLAKRVPRAERQRIIKEALEKVGLSGMEKKNVSRLSGGQQQRVAIARAIASGNNLILADEPTGALDNKTALEVMNIFKELNEAGQTIVIVTHNIKLAEMCKRIITIDEGAIMQDVRLS